MQRSDQSLPSPARATKAESQKKKKKLTQVRLAVHFLRHKTHVHIFMLPNPLPRCICPSSAYYAGFLLLSIR
jgi:hypothetical protein